VYKEKYFDGEKIVVEVLMDIHVFSTPEDDNVVSGKSSASVGPSLSPERLDGFYSY
jgi:hypothetical protein